MKTKQAAILLFAGSCYWVLIEVYTLISKITGGSWKYYKENLTAFFLYSSMIFVPVCMAVYAFSVIKNHSASGAAQPDLTNQKQGEQIPGIGSWLSNYLITAIPFVGFIFLIIWAIDNDNPIRKNWAIASLIFSSIITVFSIFVIWLIFVSITQRRNDFQF